MQRTFTNLQSPNFQIRWCLMVLVITLLLPFHKIQAQTTPKINSVNGLVPSCAIEEQELNLTINGSNFSTQANEEAIIRIRGTAFSGEVLFTPELPYSATQIKLIIPGNSLVIQNPGTLSIDVRQPDTNGNQVFSNVVQLPVYPKTGPINGATSVCGNTQSNYAVSKLDGAAQYEWSIISGNATIISGGTTNIARINFTNTSGNIKINVKTITSCGTISSSSTLEVLVNATPAITLPAFSAVCVNAPAVVLSSGTPAGGTYTVDGITTTTFNPAAVGVGTHTVTYYYVQNGCTASASQTIQVLAIPAVSFSASLGSICTNTEPIMLTGGSPAGGTYSGPGVTGTTFNPAVAGVGIHTISYTFTQNGCTGSALQTITVSPEPTVSLPVFADICLLAPTFALTGGAPEGGTYTVDGKIVTSFDPAVVGLGDHIIRYSFTQNGCTVSATQAIRVVPASEVTFPVMQQSICVNANPLRLSGGLPAGGTYSGPGIITDDAIYQSERFAGSNNSNFSYDIPVNNGSYTVILHFAEIYFTAAGQRVFDVNLENKKVLDDYDIFGKAGANTATTESFTVSVSDGKLTIDFIGLISEGGKDSPKISAIEVLPSASSSVSYRINAGGGPVINSRGEFAADNYFFGGNTYTSTNFINGTPTSFNPTLAGVGEHTITYSVTQNGCQNSAFQKIMVLNKPLASIIIPAEGTQVCPGEVVTLTASLVAGSKYQWFLNGDAISGAVTNTFNAEESGSYTLQVTDNNCSAISDSVVVTILDSSNILLEESSVIFCGGNDTTLHALTGNNYSYQWYRNNIMLNNQTSATLLVDQPGEYKVTLTPASCEPITSVTITVIENPEITNNSIATEAEAEICSGSTVQIIGSLPRGGTGEYTYIWQSSTDGGPFTGITDAISPDFNYATGTFTGSISFRRIVFSDSCLVISNELNFTVNQLEADNTISVPRSTTICAGNAPGTISGNTVTGEEEYSYTWESSSNNAPYTTIADANSVNLNPGFLFQTTTFRRVVTSGQCINISNELTILVNPDISGNSLSVPDTLICSNTNPGTISGGQVAGGDGTYRYAWERSLDGTSFTTISNSNSLDYTPGVLTRTTTFRRIVISGGCRNVSNEISITVNPIITGNNLTVPDATTCVNDTPGTITSGRISGGNNVYFYSWESSLDGTTFTTIPNLHTAEFNPGNLTQSTSFRRLVTSGVCTDTSNAVSITVAPIATYTVFLTVASSDFPVCGEIQYTAKIIKNVSGINYPPDPRLQQVSWTGGEDATSQFTFDWWKNDEQRITTGNTSGKLTLESLQPGEYYTVRARPISSDLDCAIFNSRPDLIATNSGTNLLFSNRIYSGHLENYTIAITADMPEIICPGTPVTFTAIPNDPNYINPSYQWILNNKEIPGATQAAFTSSVLKNADVVTVRFDSEENSCTPITAVNPITMQVSASIPNRLEKIQGPVDPEVGKTATYQAEPIDNTLDWIYQWTITYKNGQEEILAETSSTLVIPNVPPNLYEITVTKIAPEGSCADQKTATVSTFTIPLPIELLYLTAKESGQNVIVEWATAMEQNNTGFEVQVSVDAVNYRLLSFVPSNHSNSYTKQEYIFYDQEKGKSGTRYYRLKQVNFNNSSTYFGPVAVKISNLSESLVAYPNPFTKEINLEINTQEAGDMHLTIFNAIGSKIVEQKLKIKKGNNKVVLFLGANLPLGMYTIITQINDHSGRIKLLKQ